MPGWAVEILVNNIQSFNVFSDGVGPRVSELPNWQRVRGPKLEIYCQSWPKQNFRLYKQSFSIKRWTEVLRSSSRSRRSSGRRQKFVKITNIKYAEDTQMTDVESKISRIKIHMSSNDRWVSSLFAPISAPRSCLAVRTM